MNKPNLNGRQVRAIATAFLMAERMNERQRKGHPLNEAVLLQMLNTLVDVTIDILAIDDLDRVESVKNAMEGKEIPA